MADAPAVGALRHPLTAEPYTFFLIKHCFKIKHNKCAYYAL